MSHFVLGLLWLRRQSSMKGDSDDEHGLGGAPDSRQISR